jgi:phage baseplate assembly protein W
MATGYSVKLPLSISYSDGPYTLNKTLSSVVRQNVKMVIFTSPGERVMDLAFGVGIRNYLFHSMTPLVLETIRDRIIFQIKKYLPFVTIIKLDVTSNDESPNAIYVKMEYSFPSSGTQILDLEIT